MIKQIKLLTKINLLNSLNINRIVHGGKSKQRTQAIVLLVAFVFLYLYVLGIISLISIALIFGGQPSSVPLLVSSLIVLICLFFAVVRSGDMIYSKDNYDKVISLPLKPSAIVASRFFSVYIIDALISLLFMFPSAVLYAVFAHPSAIYYITVIFGTILLPLIPMTIGVALGALVTAITSRLKHIKTLRLVLGLILASGFIALSGLIGGFSSQFMLEGDAINNIANAFKSIETYYPPLQFFNNAATGGSFLDLLLFIAVSLAFFAIVIFILAKNFINICTALSSSISRHDFKMTEEKSNSPFIALFKKDIKIYFSSSMYAMNSMIGFVLLIILAVVVSFFMPSEMKDEIFLMNMLKNALPYAMGFCVTIAPITYCAVSYEGKNFGILSSLPISEKQFYSSKLLLNLLIAIPCYLISVIMMLIFLDFNLQQAINLIIVPISYILFSSVLALKIDTSNPNLHWTEEKEIVKQGTSTLFVMLWGLLSVIGGGIISIVPFVGSFISAITLLVLAWVFYKKLIRYPLKAIGEN